MNNPGFIVSIFNPRGLYPLHSVVSENIAYSVISGIPTLINELPSIRMPNHEQTIRVTLFFGSFLLSHEDFPRFNFYPESISAIVFNKAVFPEVIDLADNVISLKQKLPCLYDPYTGLGNHSDPEAYIKKIRSLDAYIDLFHSPQIPFSNLIEKIRPQYRFSDCEISPHSINQLFHELRNSRRFIHIAIHYFANASRLIHEHFIEDAGLNLNLVLEALIEDFCQISSISDKKQAIERIQTRIELPNEHLEFLEELYSSRNEFLAHIDKNMYTNSQNINDPDRYCYEHYESVCLLLKQYIKQFKD